MHGFFRYSFIFYQPCPFNPFTSSFPFLSFIFSTRIFRKYSSIIQFKEILSLTLFSMILAAEMAGPILGCHLHKPLLQLVQRYRPYGADRIPNDQRSNCLAPEALETRHRYRIRSRISGRIARGLFHFIFITLCFFGISL